MIGESAFKTGSSIPDALEPPPNASVNLFGRGGMQWIQAAESNQPVRVGLNHFQYVIVLKLCGFKPVPGETKHHGFIDSLSVHAGNQFNGAYQPGFGGIVQEPEFGFVRKIVFTMIADVFWKNMGVNIDDHGILKSTVSHFLTVLAAFIPSSE
jgi:hypothetical protein